MCQTRRYGAAARMLSPSRSITRCIKMLKRGDRAAAEELWDSYVHRLVALARARLGGTTRRAADEEDVALSAFDSFYRRAECGQFASLSDRDDLWQILVLILERKAIDLMRSRGPEKSRGDGQMSPLLRYGRTRARRRCRALVQPPNSRRRSSMSFAYS